MSKLQVVKYSREQQLRWDVFVKNSKNGVFFFERDYLEYHADRFPDHSLMFFDENDCLTALLPATLKDGALSSHAGLTFGGVLSDAKMKVTLMLDVFEAALGYLRANEISRFIYKAIPHIYHRLPSEEDLYALFRIGAYLTRRDVSTTIEMGTRLAFSKGRKWAIKQAQKHGLEVARSSDFKSFMAIEETLLRAKYKTRPVHTTGEIEMLAARFPENIKLFAAHKCARMMAGVIIYESAQVAHAQYIGASEEGKNIGALDSIMCYLIENYYSTKRHFDFGISTEDGGHTLNPGLIENKQSYGARAIVYDFYELRLA